MTPRPTSPLTGIALMAAATLCFAALDATSKHLSQTFSVPLLVWARYSFHLLLMLLFLAPSMRWKLLQTAHPKLQVARALLLVGVTGFAMAGFRVMPLAETTSLLFMAPLLVALLAGPWLGERLSLGRWIAVLCGFGGALMIARPGGNLSTAGVLFTLAAALCYAIYQIQTRQLAATENTLTMLFYTALVGTLAMSLALPLIWAGPLPTLTQALQIASLGIFGGTGHLLLIRAFRHAAATVLAPVIYAQLIWAALLGWLLHSHLPDAPALLGMALIVMSSVGLTLIERRRAEK